MTDSKTPQNERGFERLGNHVAEAMQSGTPSRERLLAQRARLVRAASSPVRPRFGFLGLQGALALSEPRQTRWRSSAVFAFGAVVAVLCAVVFSSTGLLDGSQFADRIGLGDEGALTVEHRGQTLGAEAWVTASTEPAALVFSDDSEIVLRTGAKARLVELDDRGLRMILESGHLDARVTPGGGYRWVVQAGPYQVHVLGTVFSVGWSPEEHELQVVVSRGKVRVLDSEQEGAERVLVAGDKLTMTRPDQATSTTPGPAAVEPLVDQPMKPQAEPVSVGLNDGSAALLAESDNGGAATRPGSLGVRASKKARSPGPRGEVPMGVSVGGSLPAASVAVEQRGDRDAPGAAAAEWKRLAKAGDYKGAVQAAQRVGVDGLLHTSTATDLLLLADAARLSGSVSLASRTLTTIRGRHPAHPNAAVAAFTLGRLASEAQHDDRAAVRWFETYLRQSPSGSLSEGARGRRLAALLRLGDSASARNAARDYLKHHPSGHRASVARSLLDD
jgi:hypothetical protein